MASGANRVDAFALLGTVALPLTVGGAGYAAWRTNWNELIKAFLTGPGRTSRILLVLFIIFNRKSMPFMWTVRVPPSEQSSRMPLLRLTCVYQQFRVFYAILHHHLFRKSPQLGPKALFKPMITTTHTPLLEIDYNLHKSNSTFFSDLDVSRTHLVSYLFRPALRNMTHNTQSKLVLDPKTGAPIKGPLGILLGAVECSFKKEVAAFQSYEMWSKVLCWDRKWVYIITHFVPKGTAKPTEWLDPGFRGVKVRGPSDAAGGWERKIIATGISKYVFKVGRFTVHPALMMGDSDMLPERPGGWMSGENQVGDEAADVSDVNLSVEGEWDWRRVEAQRRKGMELANNFANLEESHSLFDGGRGGAVARVWPG